MEDEKKKLEDEKKLIENDPFNPERLRISQAFDQNVGAKKLVTTIPVRKPDRQSFIRVHPDPAYHLDAAVLTLKDEGETYLVEPQLFEEIPGEVILSRLFTTITRQGDLLIWPVRLPDGNGRHNSWSASAMQAADVATKHWVRVVANLGAGGYDLYQATGDIPEPKWPELSLHDILKIAFKDKFINSTDHPVVQKLRGLR